MVHLLSQLDPMVWLMMVVVAIAFVVSAVVLVELLPGNHDELPSLPIDAAAPSGAAPLVGAQLAAAPRAGAQLVGAPPAAAQSSATRPAAALPERSEVDR